MKYGDHENLYVYGMNNFSHLSCKHHLAFSQLDVRLDEDSFQHGWQGEKGNESEDDQGHDPRVAEGNGKGSNEADERFQQNC